MRPKNLRFILQLVGTVGAAWLLLMLVPLLIKDPEIRAMASDADIRIIIMAVSALWPVSQLVRQPQLGQEQTRRRRKQAQRNQRRLIGYSLSGLALLGAGLFAYLLF